VDIDNMSFFAIKNKNGIRAIYFISIELQYGLTVKYNILYQTTLMGELMMISSRLTKICLKNINSLPQNMC